MENYAKKSFFHSNYCNIPKPEALLRFGGYDFTAGLCFEFIDTLLLSTYKLSFIIKLF